MADSVRISEMTLATVPYSGTPLFEISLPAGSGEYDTFSTSLDDLATSLSGAASSAYIVLTPTTGQTTDIPSGFGKVILNPAGVVATLGLRLPNGTDKQTIRIATRERIAALTLTAQGGRTVDWPAGELPRYGIIDLTLVTSLNAWVRA